MIAPSRLFIPQHMLEEIISHVQQNSPVEACGLLAGNGEQVHIVLPVKNELQSTTAFKMFPQEQINALYRIEEMHYQLLAIYHSHPTGPPHPSERDLENHFDPEIISVILFWNGQKWLPGGYRIEQQNFQEIDLCITSAPE